MYGQVQHYTILFADLILPLEILGKQIVTPHLLTCSGMSSLIMLGVKVNYSLLPAVLLDHLTEYYSLLSVSIWLGPFIDINYPLCREIFIFSL